MKRYIEAWEGKFVIDGKEVDSLKNWNPKKGDNIDIKLVAERKDRK